MRRGYTLVATLITIAIILVLTVVLFFGSGTLKGEAPNARKDGLGKTIPGQAKLAAKDDVCRSDLSQLRAAIQILATNEDDKPPADLRETKLPAEFYVCPVGGEAYTYDPATGEVKCPHPGHERY